MQDHDHNEKIRARFEDMERKARRHERIAIGAVAMRELNAEVGQTYGTREAA